MMIFLMYCYYKVTSVPTRARMFNTIYQMVVYYVIITFKLYLVVCNVNIL